MNRNVSKDGVRITRTQNLWLPLRQFKHIYIFLMSLCTLENHPVQYQKFDEIRKSRKLNMKLMTFSRCIGLNHDIAPTFGPQTHESSKPLYATFSKRKVNHNKQKNIKIIV